MHWIAFKEDIAASLKSAAKPKTIVIHPMAIDLVVNIDDKAQKEIAKDNVFLAKLRKQCEQSADRAVKEMETTLKKADSQAPGFPEDMIGLFLRPVHVTLEKSFDEACKKIERDAAKLLDDYRKTNDAYKKVTIKVDLETKFEGIEIPVKRKVGGGIKLAPVEVGDTLTDANTRLRAFVTETEKFETASLDVEKALEALNTERLNLLKAGATKKVAGSDDTSAAASDDLKKEKAEVTRQIALRESELAKLGELWKELSKAFKMAETEHDAWQKKFNAGKSKLSPEKVKQITVQIKKAEVAVDAVLKGMGRVSAALKALEPVQAKMKKAAELVESGDRTWGREAQGARNLDKLLAVAASDFEKIVQQRVQVVNSAEKLITKESKP